MTPPCPDFELAPLRAYRRDFLLTTQNSFESFLLALATAYNDLKSVMWVMQQLENCKETVPTTLSPEAGQWTGMRVFTTRYAIGILNEVVEAIRSADEAGFLGDPKLLAVVQNVDGLTQAAWADLVAMARKDPALSATATFLDRVRNRAAFHYDRTRLFQGYQYHFVTLAPRPENEFAYVSIGDTMEQTRFYFADAAAQHAYGLWDPNGDLMVQANLHLKGMSLAIWDLLRTYLAQNEQPLA